MSFVDYLGDYPFKNVDMTSIEIGDYVTEDYLKKAVAGENFSRTISSWYDIFTYDIENDVVNVHPAYYVNMDERRIHMNDIFLDLAPEQADIMIDGYIDSVERYVDTNVQTDVKIYLETVLDYYGMISEEQTDYYLSKDEILELYNNYSKDVYVSKNSSNSTDGNRISMKR